MPRSAARATKSHVVAAAQLREHRPGRELDGLRDQREPVLVVAVDDDDREVRVLAGDQLGRLLRPRRRTA